MESNTFKVSKTVVWMLAFGNIFLVGMGTFFRIKHWELSNLLLLVGIAVHISILIILLEDMIRHKIYNKQFWVMSLFIMPGIAPIIYLIRRKELVIKGTNS
jgi:hypothetical protein